MTNSIDTCHFQDLAGKDPEDVCRRALCGYDRNKGCYTLSVWGEEYGIYPGESKILRIRDDNADINIFFWPFHPSLSLDFKGNTDKQRMDIRKRHPWRCWFFFAVHTQYQPI